MQLSAPRLGLYVLLSPDPVLSSLPLFSFYFLSGFYLCIVSVFFFILSLSRSLSLAFFSFPFSSG